MTWRFVCPASTAAVATTPDLLLTGVIRHFGRREEVSSSETLDPQRAQEEGISRFLGCFGIATFLPR